jgi:hypothetical protein
MVSATPSVVSATVADEPATSVGQRAALAVAVRTAPASKLPLAAAAGEALGGVAEAEEEEAEADGAGASPLVRLHAVASVTAIEATRIEASVGALIGPLIDPRCVRRRVDRKTIRRAPPSCSDMHEVARGIYVMSHGKRRDDARP